jgi:N-methylhydantoinase B/oxoprolinase/acetone carboxylase alpha subunit
LARGDMIIVESCGGGGYGSPGGDNQTAGEAGT